MIQPMRDLLWGPRDFTKLGEKWGAPFLLTPPSRIRVTFLSLGIPPAVPQHCVQPPAAFPCAHIKIPQRGTTKHNAFTVSLITLSTIPQQFLKCIILKFCNYLSYKMFAFQLHLLGQIFAQARAHVICLRTADSPLKEHLIVHS